MPLPFLSANFEGSHSLEQPKDFWTLKSQDVILQIQAYSLPRQVIFTAPIHDDLLLAMSIRQLPEDVVAKIKSSTVIVSLNGVVGGLLTNAFDAGATKVNVTVDYSRGNCTVEDNGCGIPPAEFKEYGGIGRLHRMSSSSQAFYLVRVLTLIRYIQVSA